MLQKLKENMSKELEIEGNYLNIIKAIYIKPIIDIIVFFCCCCCCSIAKSCLTLCDLVDCSMTGYPLLYPRVCSYSCLLNWWCYLTISSSVARFSSCPQSFPASGSFPISQLLASGDHSIGASASASVLPMNIKGWLPLGFTGLVSLSFKGHATQWLKTVHFFFSSKIRNNTVVLIFIPSSHHNTGTPSQKN